MTTYTINTEDRAIYKIEINEFNDWFTGETLEAEDITEIDIDEFLQHEDLTDWENELEEIGYDINRLWFEIEREGERAAA